MTKISHDGERWEHDFEIELCQGHTMIDHLSLPVADVGAQLGLLRAVRMTPAGPWRDQVIEPSQQNMR